VVVVKTSVGEVRGRVVSASFGHVTDVTVDQYLGIPFAVPPVGQLRYADPVPLDRLPSGTLTPLRGLLGRDYAVKVKFHYASWFGASSELAPNQLV